MRSRLKTFLALYDAASRRAVLIAICIAVALALFDFASLVVLYPVFSTLAGGSEGSSIPIIGGVDPGVLIVIAMALMIGRSILGFFSRMWWGYRAADAEVSLSSKLLNTYAFAPYAFHLKSNSSDLLGRAVSHVNIATTSGLGGLVLLAGDLASTIGMTAALFVLSPVAATAISVYLGLTGGFFLLFSRRFVRRQADLLSNRISQVYSQAANVLRGIRELTVSGGRGVALREMDKARAEMTRSQRNLLILSEVPRLVLEVALYAAILLSLLVVLNQAEYASALPIVALYVVAGLRILPAIARLLGTTTQVRYGFEIGAKLTAEMNEIEVVGAQVHRPADPLSPTGELVLNNVTFAYDGGERVLDALNLRVPFGNMIGVVGPSGSGKTTLLGIMLGLLPPDTGAVTFGGSDVGVSDPAWMNRVAYVPQDVFVADDTVLANVCLGEPEGKRDEDGAIRALTRARLDTVIDALPNGIHTNLHEGGARLSVGQRQRLGIARALYRDAKVLLLDEPTAALDNDTEAKVVETLRELHAQVTIVVVAHRVRTLEGADAVYRLEGGSLAIAN